MGERIGMVVFRKQALGRTVALALLLAGTAWGASSVPPLFDGRLRPPEDSTGASVRDLFLRADKAGATEYARGRRLQCEADLSAALREINYQHGQAFYERDFTRGEFLLSIASDSAIHLLVQVKGQARRDRLEVESLIALTEERLVSARSLAAHADGDAYVRQRLATAEMRLKDAKALAAGGRYNSALRSIRESLSAVKVTEQKSMGLLARFDDPALLSRWKDWIREAQVASRAGGPALVVVKERHRLDVYRNGRVVRSLEVDLGANTLRQKLHAGDRATPEGRYRITQKKSHGQSKFGQALLLDYPNAEDRRRFAEARSRNQITRRTSIGGLIEIHGEGGRGEDWTDGCIAPDDTDMAWLYTQVQVGTPVVIVGSDGSDGPIRTTLKAVNGRP